MIIDSEVQELYADLESAVRFYHKVKSAPPEERNAVGTDHWDRLIKTACRFVDAVESCRNE